MDLQNTLKQQDAPQSEIITPLPLKIVASIFRICGFFGVLGGIGLMIQAFFPLAGRTMMFIFGAIAFLLAGFSIAVGNNIIKMRRIGYIQGVIVLIIAIIFQILNYVLLWLIPTFNTPISSIFSDLAYSLIPIIMFVILYNNRGKLINL